MTTPYRTAPFVTPLAKREASWSLTTVKMFVSYILVVGYAILLMTVPSERTVYLALWFWVEALGYTGLFHYSRRKDRERFAP